MKARRMNGAGNSFLLVDDRGRDGARLADADQIRSWSKQHGIDQFLWLRDSDAADAFMQIWNADGDRVGACGNGTRAAGWAMLGGEIGRCVSIDTDGGLLSAEAIAPFKVSVDMGAPRLGWQEIPLAREMDTVEMDFAVEAGAVRLSGPAGVNMGNPHAVFFVDDAEALDVETLGAMVERDPLFPERVNASFASRIADNDFRLRVFERGVGVTLACGTAACATLVAAHRRGLAGRSATIRADGGELHIAWRDDNHVILTGPVEDEGAVELSWES